MGDSAAMHVLGHDSTVPATVDEMIVLTRAVTRGGGGFFLVVADMPFGLFQIPTRMLWRTPCASSRRPAPTQ